MEASLRGTAYSAPPALRPATRSSACFRGRVVYPVAGSQAAEHPALASHLAQTSKPESLPPLGPYLAAVLDLLET